MPIPTLGGHFFWTDRKCKNGWRLQENDVFGQYRVLDPRDNRHYTSTSYSKAKRVFDSLSTSRCHCDCDCDDQGVSINSLFFSNFL